MFVRCLSLGLLLLSATVQPVGMGHQDGICRCINHKEGYDWYDLKDTFDIM